MAIIFPKGKFCTADGSHTFLQGSIRLNTDNPTLPSNYYYQYPSIGLGDIPWGEVHTVSGVAREASDRGFPWTARGFMFYSSVDADPSTDYFQQTPREICDIDGVNLSAAFDVVWLYNTYGTHYKFYPDHTDTSFYIDMVFERTSWGCRIYYSFIRNNTTYYSTTRDVNGNSSYGGSPYNGSSVVVGAIPWKGKNFAWQTDGLVYSWANAAAKYKFVGPGAGTWDDVASMCTLYLGYSVTTSINWWNNWSGGYEPKIPDSDNPYWDGGTSDQGGGGGNFSEDSDTPTTDTLPTDGAVGTGFATIFKPDLSELRNLSALFWNSNVFTFLQNLVENITDMFISLAMVPFNVQAGRTVSVTWLGIDTAVSLTLAAKQFYELDMGTIDMANDGRIYSSGSALDYSPFSSLGIYLPFIGYRELDIDECRDAGINLRYRIDILSGSCVAILRVGGRDLYEFTGNCLTQIPLTNENMQSLVSDAVNVGIALVNSQAAAGVAAADTTAAAGATNEAIGDSRIAHAQSHLTQSRGQLASATANAAMGMKPNFAKSGSVSGSNALMAVKQPYLFLRTPRQSLPDHYQRYCGFPSNITGKLGTFSGFTVVEDIRLNGLVATSPEVAEIYDLLKKGVII